ncbi:hypothetical protein BN10_1700011 [Phycicoccus elongatus Lp2]|uniref:Uncharacterized protein n=1 Tax=Phycicoccus elongatus Lp2 TaxID=1193181 RepID=N0E152_9MICO|nr:hypothetical protein [Phycicoccus elongatus]CCH69465.1 hypothetical protein BN10_1700011 [Phycicoccus elongatus Lp2]
MHIPSIPGYEVHDGPRTLGRLWAHPDGDHPAGLWPEAELLRICPDPTGWLTIEEHFHRSDDMYGGTHCVLIDDGARDPVLHSGTPWAGRSDIGKVEVWSDGKFSDGLTASRNGDGGLVFFSAVREHHGFVIPTFEITPTFLWYWDAFPSDRGWSYFDSAGRSVELIRIAISMEEWKVEVSALEMRTFLAASGRELLVQKDYTLLTTDEIDPFARVDANHRTAWSNFDWFAMEDDGLTDVTAFSNVMGKYVVSGAVTARVRRLDARNADKNYVEYIFGVDPRTGDMRRHTCNPRMLGDYADSSRLHSMTPVYFSREVLNRYASEPSRYRVTAGRIWCLDLWGLDISTNTAGLIEVYLGELGALPEGEQTHWLAHNVPPEGTMDEGRFRRDFLNQSVGSPDPVGDLRRARRRAAEATKALLGSAAWRELDPQAATEFEALLGPTSNDPSALTAPTITLTKSLVDGIDPAPLKEFLGGSEPGEKSISLLRRLLSSLGDTEDAAEIFAALQAFRSAGGVAHLGGSKAGAASARLGIDGMAPLEAFAHMTVNVTSALNHVADLVEATPRRPQVESS